MSHLDVVLLDSENNVKYSDSIDSIEINSGETYIFGDFSHDDKICFSVSFENIFRIQCEVFDIVDVLVKQQTLRNGNTNIENLPESGHMSVEITTPRD